MQRKKPTYLQQRKPKDQINKKLLIWAGSIFAVVCIAMIALLLFNK
ncbi:MAG: hypothetical protein K0S39_3308 [Paenibacillus sp.]|jgi:hypothetical protein|nr:hypothetical protein [Paenibacillus sp.]